MPTAQIYLQSVSIQAPEGAAGVAALEQEAQADGKQAERKQVEQGH